MSKIALSGDASGTGTFTIASPNSNSNFTLTLPAESGTVLTTGSTTGISASALSTGTIPKARFPTGTVLQVAQTVLSTNFSSATTGSYVAITGLSVSITPTSSTSKILILCHVMTADNNNYPMMFHIYRNGSVCTPTGPTTGFTPNNAYVSAQGGNASNAGWSGPLVMNYLDSPATTSSLTYQVYGAKPSVSVAPVVVNPTSAGGSNTAGGSSSITVMEIAA